MVGLAIWLRQCRELADNGRSAAMMNKLALKSFGKVKAPLTDALRVSKAT
jgi:hypothetical protein